MTNDRSQYPLKMNHFFNPVTSKNESSSINSTSLKLNNSKMPRIRSNINQNSSEITSKQIYTFSNPPREHKEMKTSSCRKHLDRRVSSAPNQSTSQISRHENIKQPKSSSANESSSPRSRNSNQPVQDILVSNQKEKDSFNALIKEQEKSKVPKSVQRRRLYILFPRSTSKLGERSSSISPNNQSKIEYDNTNISPISSVSLNNSNEFSQSIDNNDPDFADSMQLAAILAQMHNESNQNETSTENLPTGLDLSRYEYVVANTLEKGTLRLSPRTLTPDEELAARVCFSQYYRYEMRYSANAPIPELMRSITNDNNSTIGNGVDIGQTFTFKINSTTDGIKNLHILENNESFQSTNDNEIIQLRYDATLKLFYNPNTGAYYELKSS